MYRVSRETNRSYCLDRMFHLDRYAMKQLQQNQQQTTVLNTLKWLHCRESHAPCLHRLRNIGRPLFQISQ